MIFLNDKRFHKILYKALGYDDEVINAMRLEYMEAVQKLTINLTLEYIKDNKLEAEDAKIDQLSDQLSDSNDPHQDLGKLYSYMLEIVQTNPALDQKLNNEIRKLDRDINEMFLESLDDDSLLEIANNFVEDFKILREIRENYPGLPSGPSSKDYQPE